MLVLRSSHLAPRTDSASSVRLVGVVEFVYLLFPVRITSRRGASTPSYWTVCSKLSAVRWFHRRYQGVGLHPTPQLGMLLRGIRRPPPPSLQSTSCFPCPSLSLSRSTVSSCFSAGQAKHQLLWVCSPWPSSCSGNPSTFPMESLHPTIFESDKSGFEMREAGRRLCGREQAAAISVQLHGAKNDQFGRGTER